MEKNAATYGANDYASGVFLSSEFKEFTNNVPVISEVSDPDIYNTKLDEIHSEHWLFAITFISNSLSFPLSSIDKAVDEVLPSKLGFMGGSLNKIPYEENPANTEPTFTVSLRFSEKMAKKEAEVEARTISDVVTASLLLDRDIPGQFNMVTHSARALTPNEYKEAINGCLNLRRIEWSLPLYERNRHVIHAIENGLESDFQLFTSTFSFLENVELVENHRKIKTAYGMVNDGLKARTQEQGFLTLYTALNYLIEDVGRQSRTAKSEAQMALKMADKEIITTQQGIEWIEELKRIHRIRSNVLWNAKTIENEEFVTIREFLQKLLPYYFKYWESQPDR